MRAVRVSAPGTLRVASEHGTVDGVDALASVETRGGTIERSA